MVEPHDAVAGTTVWFYSEISKELEGRKTVMQGTVIETWGSVAKLQVWVNMSKGYGAAAEALQAVFLLRLLYLSEAACWEATARSALAS